MLFINTQRKSIELRNGFAEPVSKRLRSRQLSLRHLSDHNCDSEYRILLQQLVSRMRNKCFMHLLNAHFKPCYHCNICSGMLLSHPKRKPFSRRNRITIRLIRILRN